MTEVHLLWNGVGGPPATGVVEAFRRRDVVPVVHATPTPEAATEAARDAVASGADRLVAIGGDGAVHLAAGTVAGTRTILGVVPAGTGNDFARATGLLDGDLDTQVGRALAEPVDLDAIRSGHGWITTVATLGFSGDVTARANAMRRPRGARRYAVATLLQLPRLRTYAVEVTVDGRRAVSRSTLLAIGNTAYFGGGMKVCPDAVPTDGRVQVVSIGDVSRTTFVRVFPRVFSGSHVDRPEVTVTSGSVVTIEGDGTDLWADGERLGPLPVRLEVVPGALRVAGARLPDPDRPDVTT